jgi:phenylacetate-CoA ligase
MSFGSVPYDAAITLAGLRRYRTGWKRHATWSTDEMASYQLTRLRAIVGDAARHVPFYRDQFAALGFDPRTDLRTLDDLAHLPILSKQTVREESDRLTRRPLPRWAVTERTSGSTGEPLAVQIAPRQIAIEKATVWRHWNWLGYRFRDPMAIIRTYVPNEGEPLWRHDTARNFLYCSAYHLDSENALSFLERLQTFRPRFLRGYPSSLAILADVAHEHGIGLTGLRAILTASETLTADVRSKLTTTFNAPVSDWYGLAEQVVTAAECACGQGLHRHDDYGLWELQPLDDGTGRCRIIGTNLHNTAMPLLRYDTGDLTVPGGHQPCACGITLPRIERITGRIDDDLITPDGQRIPSVNFYSVFRDFPAIRRFQMIQRRPDAVEVHLDARGLDTDAEQRLQRALQRRLGHGLTVTLHRDATFEQSDTGKCRTVISRISKSPHMEVPV